MATVVANEGPRNGRGPIRRYGSVYAAAGTGVAVVALSYAFLPGLAIELGASAFFLTYLGLVLARMRRMTPAFLRSHADESDVPGFLVLCIALGSVALASGSLFWLLNSGRSPDRVHLVLGIAAVVLGWLCLHVMLAFHYAYEYYETDAASPLGKDGRRKHVGGLDFPGSEQPDALSFVYFSFVVAMTAQVSDVTVTSNEMRRLVLLHGILSFFFNTVIIAIAVNIVVSLGH